VRSRESPGPRISGLPILTPVRSVQELSTGPTNWCKASVNVGFLASEKFRHPTRTADKNALSGNYVNFVVTLIALNLQLSIVYGVHTANWTKFYLGGSFIASVGIMMPGGPLSISSLSAYHSCRHDL
jgi:hypothetical protein